MTGEGYTPPPPPRPGEWDIRAIDFAGLEEPPLIGIQMENMGTYLCVRIRVNQMFVATGVGATLGEALMIAGAILAGEPVRPLHQRILAALRRWR